jgi:hypothetical protein
MARSCRRRGTARRGHNAFRPSENGLSRQASSFVIGPNFKASQCGIPIGLEAGKQRFDGGNMGAILGWLRRRMADRYGAKPCFEVCVQDGASHFSLSEVFFGFP